MLRGSGLSSTPASRTGESLARSSSGEVRDPAQIRRASKCDISSVERKRVTEGPREHPSAGQRSPALWFNRPQGRVHHWRRCHQAGIPSRWGYGFSPPPTLTGAHAGGRKEFLHPLRIPRIPVRSPRSDGARGKLEAKREQCSRPRRRQRRGGFHMRALPQCRSGIIRGGSWESDGTCGSMES